MFIYNVAGAAPQTHADPLGRPSRNTRAPTRFVQLKLAQSTEYVTKSKLDLHSIGGLDSTLMIPLIARLLPCQAADEPADVPEDSMFTEEQLKTLDSIAATNEYRMDFAKTVYYIDITVR